MLKDTFGFRLRRAMSIRRVKLHEFAAEIGRSPETVKKWRGGYMMPKAETLERIAEMLNVSIDFLTGRTDEMEVKRGYKRNQNVQSDAIRQRDHGRAIQTRTGE